MKYLLLVFILFSSTTNADELSVLKKASTSLLIVDWAQTIAIASSEDYTESNIFLGRKPSKTKINIYFSSAALLNYNLPKSLPKDLRRFIRYSVVSIETGYIAGNISLGIKVFN